MKRHFSIDIGRYNPKKGQGLSLHAKPIAKTEMLYHNTKQRAARFANSPYVIRRKETMYVQIIFIGTETML